MGQFRHTEEFPHHRDSAYVCERGATNIRSEVAGMEQKKKITKNGYKDGDFIINYMLHGYIVRITWELGGCKENKNINTDFI